MLSSASATRIKPKLLVAKLGNLKRCLVLILIAYTYVHFTAEKQVSTVKINNFRPTCHSNQIGCGSGGNQKKNIGLLLTKDDGKILETWFEKNSRYFTALVVLDGSVDSNETEAFFSGCKFVSYYHEKEFSSLKAFSDGELRELGHKLITQQFGYNVWITMAHTDEFYIHSPFKVIKQAEIEKADFVRWSALHVLPHPSEYESFLRNPGSPVTELFRHYYHFGPTKGAFLESRMFYSKIGLSWRNMQGSILPSNLKKEFSLHPAYMHYKLYQLSLDAYTSEGVHKRHWDRVSSDMYQNADAKKGVGIRWNVQNIRDFFVDHFPNSKKYNHISVLGKNNMIEKYLDIGEKFKDRFFCSPFR
jgi:hypothetical protein